MLDKTNEPADNNPDRAEKNPTKIIVQRVLRIAKTISNRIKGTDENDTSVAYTKFSKTRKNKMEFPIYRAEDIYENYTYQYFENTRDCIIEVDFAEIKQFRDFGHAAENLVVMASDGIKGTLSHLTIPITDDEQKMSIEIFTEKLTGYWNKKVPVCLAGGKDGVSDKFIAAIKNSLIAKGFTVSDAPENNDLGGKSIHRNCILSADKVIVRSKDYRNHQLDKLVTLAFPAVI